MSQLPTGTGASYVRIGNERFDDERQRESIDEWLAAGGLKIEPVHRYEDIGFNRDTPLETRVGLSKLLAAVRSGKLAWVVVDSRDRFDTTDETGLPLVTRTLQEHNCRLVTFERGAERGAEGGA